MKDVAKAFFQCFQAFGPLSGPSRSPYPNRSRDELRAGRGSEESALSSRMGWLLIAFLGFSITDVSGQGFINFNNQASNSVVAPVYGPEASNPAIAKTGNTASGFPAGTQIYTGPPLAGTGCTAQLWGAPIGSGENQLTLIATTSFGTASAAGFFIASTNSVPGVPAGQGATLQVRAWDNHGGAITSWAQVLADTNVPRGASALFDSQPLGSSITSATDIAGLRSFNLHSLPAIFPPSIIVQPQSQTVVAGANVTFSVSATGTEPLNYQWFYGYGDPDLVEYQWYYAYADGISGAASSTLTPSNVQVSRYFRVLIWNSIGSVFSDVVSLTVNRPPIITTQPRSQDAPVGTSVIFATTATGTAPLSYQWRINGTNISGATNLILTLTNLQPL